MGDNAAEQQEWLRGEWERLNRQREHLLAETRNLQASRDVAALRAHAERLWRHKEELAAFRAVLEAHQARFRTD